MKMLSKKLRPMAAAMTKPVFRKTSLIFLMILSFQLLGQGAAAESACGTATDAIDAIRRGEAEIGLRGLKCLASEGDRDAPYYLGRHYIEQSRNFDKAEKWLVIAQERGHPNADSYLRYIEYTRNEEIKNRKRYEANKARVTKKYASITGTFEEARSYFNSQTYGKACLLLAKLTNANDVQAMYFLGYDLIMNSPRSACGSPLRFVHLDPLDTPVIPKKNITPRASQKWGSWVIPGAQLVAQAAALGLHDAQYLLGRLFARDRIYGVLRQNDEVARILLEKSAKGGSRDGQYRFGAWLKNRENDLNGGMDWMLKAARQEHRKAQAEMAGFYLEDGPSRDPDEASYWLRQLANQTFDIKLNIWARKMLGIR